MRGDHGRTCGSWGEVRLLRRDDPERPTERPHGKDLLAYRAFDGEIVGVMLGRRCRPRHAPRRTPWRLSIASSRSGIDRRGVRERGVQQPAWPCARSGVHTTVNCRVFVRPSASAP